MPVQLKIRTVFYIMLALIPGIPTAGFSQGPDGLQYPALEFPKHVDQGSGDRWEFIGLGEVVAVQKRKGALRILSVDPLDLQRDEAEKIREYFLKKQRPLTLLNRRGEVAGTFTANRLEIRYDRRPAKLREFLLFGTFDLERDHGLRTLSVGYRAGLYRRKLGYLRPVQPAVDRTARRALPEIRHQVDGKQMRYIPGGFAIFGQGDNPNLDNFNPDYDRREFEVMMRIKPFYLDKYEVTNVEYHRFCTEAGHPFPPSWKDGRYPRGKANHPVIVASYRDAEAYARWTGKRLPTEFEWEFAARGDARAVKINGDPTSVYNAPPAFPFRGEFDPAKCNTLESGHGDTIPVTAIRDESPYRIFGMCGNAREWTASWYQAYPGHRLPVKRAVSGRVFKVIRGGSFDQSREYAASNFRDYGGFPSLAEDRSAGFRLAVSAGD